MRLHLTTLVLLVALLACGGEETPATGAAAGGAPETGPETGAESATDAVAATGAPEGGTGATVAVASTSLGDVLVDSAGRTLYLFLPDEQGEPTCTDDCAANWPPLTGTPTAGSGADAAQLGTVEGTDAALHVTYGGWPLYTFAGDAEPGDTNGQGVGDVWFAVTPAGEPVREEAVGAASSSGY